MEEILQTYDRERRVLPAPVRMWEWGWTKSAETWNGRIASALPSLVPLSLSVLPSPLWHIYLAVFSRPCRSASHPVDCEELYGIQTITDKIAAWACCMGLLHRLS